MNVLLINTYQRCSDQWSVAPSGKIIGLPNADIALPLQQLQQRYQGEKIDWIRFTDDLKMVAAIVANELNRDKKTENATT